MSAINPRQLFLLDEACKPIEKAFGEYPYLVGSAADGKAFRDVDVRLILEDKKHDALRHAVGQDAIAFLGFAIGEYLAARTGLPIDFQVQRQTEANAKHNGVRNPLGIRSLSNYKGDAPSHTHEPVPDRCDNCECDMPIGCDGLFKEQTECMWAMAANT